MSKIVGIQRLDETIQPVSGDGDNWHMTWARDDKQYVNLCDGKGWSKLPEYTGRMYNTRMYIINGDAPNHTFEYMPGFPDLEFIYPPTKEKPDSYSRYYGFGIFATEAFRYSFLSTPRVPFGAPNNRFVGVKLIYSADDGKTWKNQDGSPIRWEEWGERNSSNMLFFEEA